MFIPIDLPRDLPEPGSAYEAVGLDFKAKVDITSRFEPAKDVAAFANAYGGTILVGAAADGECIKKYLPFSASDASLVQRCYEESVRDRCRPAPLVSIAVIARDGGVVVAVNVWPVVGQPVGVELKKADLVKFSGSPTPDLSSKRKRPFSWRFNQRRKRTERQNNVFESPTSRISNR